MTIDNASEAGAYAGAGAAVILWGLSASELAVILSAVFAGASFCVHWWLSWNRNRREQREHERTMNGDD